MLAVFNNPIMRPYPLISMNCFYFIHKQLADFLSLSKRFKIYMACFIFFFLTSGLAGASGDQDSINLKLQDSNIVHLPAGTYILTDSIILQSNKVLEGEPGTVITISDNAGWPAWKPLISGTGVQNVTIRGIKFDGNDANQLNTPVWYGHSGKEDGKRWGQGYYNIIHVIDCDSITVDNCIMCNSLGDGFRVKTSTNIGFFANTCFRLGHDAFYAIDSQNIEAYNNRITTRINSALRLWNVEQARFYNNTIDAQLDSIGGNPGIQIEDNKGQMTDIEICDNIISKTWGCGIWLISYEKGISNIQGILIHHNLFWQEGQSYNIPYTSGIVNDGVKGTKIYNNVFDGSKNNAFRNQEGGQGTEIKDNIFTNTLPHVAISQSGTGYAIADLVGSDLLISSNCFFNNANGNCFRCSSTGDDLREPKTYQTSSGWTWTGSTWTCAEVPPLRLGSIQPTQTRGTTDTDTHEITSIFDILDRQFSTTALIQQEKHIIPAENWQKKGQYTEATLSIDGFRNIAEIGGIEYINGSAQNCAIINYQTRNDAPLGAGQASELFYQENGNNLTIYLTVKTSWYVKSTSTVHINGLSISIPYVSTRSETEAFTTTAQAPMGFPAINTPRCHVTIFNNSYNPHAIVDLSQNFGIVEEDYSYNGSSSTHFKLAGEVETKQNGLSYVNYSKISTWKGTDNQIAGYNDRIYIKGVFHKDKLNISVTTPYETVNVTYFNITEVPDESGAILNPGLWAFIGTFTIFGISIYRNGKRVIPKW